MLTVRCKEVERAASLIRSVASGKDIVAVDTQEDTIVFTGTTHEEFVSPVNISVTLSEKFLRGQRDYRPHGKDCR
jgi:hypothetical protein